MGSLRFSIWYITFSNYWSFVCHHIDSFGLLDGSYDIWRLHTFRVLAVAKLSDSIWHMMLVQAIRFKLLTCIIFFEMWKWWCLTWRESLYRITISSKLSPEWIKDSYKEAKSTRDTDLSFSDLAYLIMKLKIYWNIFELSFNKNQLNHLLFSHTYQRWLYSALSHLTGVNSSMVSFQK